MATKNPRAATIPAPRCYAARVQFHTMRNSLTEQLYDAFVAHAGRPCLRVPAARDWTYGDLAELSAQLAGVLRELGVGSGDRVLVQVDKSPEAVALYLACLWIGAAYVPINTAYTRVEVEYFLTDARPRVFVCRPADEAELAAISGEVLLFTLGAAGDGSLLARAALATPSRDVVAPAPSDVAAIL